MSLKLAGFIYTLYVEELFIEYFDTIENAQTYGRTMYNGSQRRIVKPVAFFKLEESP